jgi:fructuronate reductase
LKRLSEHTLAELPKAVGRSCYDRRRLTTGVVHLGTGAFHRAHQAALFEALAEQGDLRWGIQGASLRSGDVAAQMNPQDGLYSLTVRDGDLEQTRVIGVVKDVLVAPPDPAALVAAMAEPAVHLVTLTVTEKGYLPAEGETPSHAVSAVGFIVAALAERRARGLRPFTALSCDNLPRNGARLEAATLDMARRHDPGLADWIEEGGAFPETMVDRIVPATTPADIDTLSASLGVRDAAMVKTEPFLQWVIEDRFAGERPDFESVGVQIAASVAPWEAAKLRLLNGAHSAIAYLGGLAGIEFVHAFVADPERAGFIERLWEEAASTLDPPQGLNIGVYQAALMARFRNPALEHRTRQIAMDGSQKLPQRLLASIAVRLERGQSFDSLGLAVAAWMRWQGGRDDRGRSFTIDDPLAGVMAKRILGAHSPEERVSALLGVREVFTPTLAANAQFRDVLVQSLRRLEQGGALGALRARA